MDSGAGHRSEWKRVVILDDPGQVVDGPGSGPIVLAPLRALDQESPDAQSP